MSVTVCDKPMNPYDVQAWESYYAKNPNVRRSCGADGADDDLDALKSEIESLRNHNKKLLDEKKKEQSKVNKMKEQLDSLSAKVKDLPEDFDTESLLKMKEVFDQSEYAQMIKDGKIDEVVEKRVSSKLASYEEKIGELDDTLKNIMGERDNLRNKLEKTTIDNALIKAAEGKVNKHAIDDVLYRANGVFSLNENGEIQALDADGNIVMENKKILTPELFVEGLREKAPHLFPGSEAGPGAGRRTGAEPNPFMKGSPDYNLTEQARLMKSNPDLAGKMQAEAAQAAKQKSANAA